MPDEIRVWRAPAHALKIRKGRILRPLAEMPTEQELVRDQALERASYATARATERELARTLPDRGTGWEGDLSNGRAAGPGAALDSRT